MDYKTSVKYLESFWKFGIKLGLHRIERLLHELGDPQKRIKTVHVAGTNGKGSVCAMTASILTEAGHSAGMFTSPHLISYTERFRINGKDISGREFSFYVSMIRNILKRYKKNEELPTEFEILTAMAFRYFADEKADIAVIEVGLGGRLDSTNVITPLVSVITNVDLDHTEVLGRTIKKIAEEKAGIIKEGVPVVTAAKGTALNIIKNICRMKNAKLTTVSKSRARVNIPLYGNHQIINAGVAVEAVRELKKQGFKISEADIRNGMKKTKWPARFQMLGKGPVLIVDGAHNPPAAKALRRSLLKLSGRKKVILVLGMLSYKDHKNIARELAPVSKLLIAAKPDSRFALDPVVIAKEAKTYAKEVVVEKNIRKALKTAYRSSGRTDIICATGSLYTAGEVLRAFPFI